MLRCVRLACARNALVGLQPAVADTQDAVGALGDFALVSDENDRFALAV